MHHISVDSVEGALELTTQCLCILFYSLQATHVGFAPTNMVIVAGIYRWVKISFLYFIISLFYYTCVPIQLFIGVLVASSGYLPCSFTLSKYPPQMPPLWGTIFWLFVVYFFTSVCNIQYLICYSPIFFAISFLVN